MTRAIEGTAFSGLCGSSKKFRNCATLEDERALMHYPVNSAPPSHPSGLPNPFALARMGVDLFDAGAFEAARDIFRLLLLQRSEDDSVWYWLGRCHQELGQVDAALALYTCAARAGRSRVFGALARGLRRVDAGKGRSR